MLVSADLRPPRMAGQTCESPVIWLRSRGATKVVLRLRHTLAPLPKCSRSSRPSETTENLLPNCTMPSVLKPWVEQLGLRHQGVLMACVRGCDNVPKEDPTKALARCLRAVILVSFDRKPTSFIENVNDEELRRRMVAVLKNHRHDPDQYIRHLMHGSEIIGYKHLAGTSSQVATEVVASQVGHPTKKCRASPAPCYSFSGGTQLKHG